MQLAPMPTPPATKDRAAADTDSETVLRPPRGWQLINFRELWHCRELLFFLVWRDVKVRYKQTILGVLWAVLQPALMMVVFTLFFHRLAAVSGGDVPYPLFVFAGLLPWTFFATAIANGGNSVVGSERLITKIYFPAPGRPLCRRRRRGRRFLDRVRAAGRADADVSASDRAGPCSRCR